MNILIGPAIQVRRQDKFRETPFIEVGKYVEHIKDYFDILESKLSLNIDQRSIFVATDEPKVLTELSLRYPEFNWVTCKNTPESSTLQNRYSNQGQDAIIKDVFVLAYSDFLVSMPCWINPNSVSSRYLKG